MTRLLASSLNLIRKIGINIEIGIATIAKRPAVAEGSKNSEPATMSRMMQKVIIVRGRTETERFSPTNAAMLQIVANAAKPIIVRATTDSDAHGV